MSLSAVPLLRFVRGDDVLIIEWLCRWLLLHGADWTTPTMRSSLLRRAQSGRCWGLVTLTSLLPRRLRMRTHSQVRSFDTTLASIAFAAGEA